jgi:hypothetical protein
VVKALGILSLGALAVDIFLPFCKEGDTNPQP